MNTPLPASIRKATGKRDFEFALQLLRDHIGALDIPEARSYLDVTVGSLEETFNAPGAALLLSSVNGSAAGMIAYVRFGRTCAQIEYFYVAPHCRGCGLGNSLMNAVLAASKSDGYYSAILATLPKLTSARAIYQRNGFSRIPPAYPDLPDAEYYLRTL